MTVYCWNGGLPWIWYLSRTEPQIAAQSDPERGIHAGDVLHTPDTVFIDMPSDLWRYLPEPGTVRQMSFGEDEFGLALRIEPSTPYYCKHGARGMLWPQRAP